MRNPASRQPQRRKARTLNTACHGARGWERQAWCRHRAASDGTCARPLRARVRSKEHILRQQRQASSRIDLSSLRVCPIQVTVQRVSQAAKIETREVSWLLVSRANPSSPACRRGVRCTTRFLKSTYGVTCPQRGRTAAAAILLVELFGHGHRLAFAHRLGMPPAARRRADNRQWRDRFHLWPPGFRLGHDSRRDHLD